VLRRFSLIFALAMAIPAVGWAQSAPTPAKTAAAKPTPSPAVVDKAQAAVTTAEKTIATLIAQRGQLTARYQQQLAAIDRLKKQKASWRRDRELNTAQADANDTAKRLTALDASLHKAQRSLLDARTVAVRAIDAELAAGGATGPRGQQLATLRNKLAPPLPAPKKIVIPDAEIDPLADPQELEQQAAALAAVEKQLEAQRKGLDAQHKDLALVAELRGAHERAGELATRDDDQPQRGGGGGRAGREATSGDQSPAPTSGAGNDSSGGAGTSGTGGSGESTGGSFGGDKLTVGTTFETNAAVALGEVIDRSTIDGLVRASRSGDPKQRAEAAKQARDAVAKRLEQLRKKRSMIEARAKQLRGK
jgi:hypothetical protein